MLTDFGFTLEESAERSKRIWIAYSRNEELDYTLRSGTAAYGLYGDAAPTSANGAISAPYPALPGEPVQSHVGKLVNLLVWLFMEYPSLVSSYRGRALLLSAASCHEIYETVTGDIMDNGSPEHDLIKQQEAEFFEQYLGRTKGGEEIAGLLKTATIGIGKIPLRYARILYLTDKLEALLKLAKETIRRGHSGSCCNKALAAGVSSQKIAQCRCLRGFCATNKNGETPNWFTPPCRQVKSITARDIQSCWLADSDAALDIWSVSFLRTLQSGPRDDIHAVMLNLLYCAVVDARGSWFPWARKLEP